MYRRLLCFLLLLLAACGQPSGLPTSRQEQAVDGITIAFEAVDQPKINDAQEFLVTLSDAQGQPIDDASVYLDLTMPAMPMGTNRPIAASEGEGRYHTITAYTMTGAWEVFVVAEIDGKEYRALFTREVGE